MAAVGPISTESSDAWRNAPIVAEFYALATLAFAKEVQMAIQTYARSRSPSEMAIKAEALLSRYPDLSEKELENLIDMFPALGILDVGLMTADDRLSGQLEEFYRDHGKKLKMPVSSWVAFLAVPAILALGVLWWGLAPTAGM